MGKLLGAHDSYELDRPDLNKCPDCGCFFDGDNCPLCGKTVVSKRGRNKGIFYSCSGYPDCSFSSWDLPTKEHCPNCGKMLFLKKTKEILVCHDKECGYQAPAPAKEDKGE